MFIKGAEGNEEKRNSQAYKVVNKGCLDYQLINNKNRLISFPDVMIWATQNNVTK